MKKNIKDLSRDSEIEYTADFFTEHFGAVSQNDMASAFATATAPDNNRWEAANTDTSWKEMDEDYDGQLAVDVFHTDTAIIIQSAVAGVRNQDLDISINGDMITIKGKREPQYGHIAAENYFIEECYWGSFSRSIILPIDIIHDDISASLEHGILTITLPKAKRSQNTRISVRQLD